MRCVLGQLARRIAGDWRQRYGTAPWLMETYVEATRSGTVYRAANWIEIGMTTGRGRQDRAGKGGLPEKRVFVYPLSPARLKRLCGPLAAPLPGWVRREFGGAKLGDRGAGGPTVEPCRGVLRQTAGQYPPGLRLAGRGQGCAATNRMRGERQSG
jgi:hypothetical protein